MTIDVSSNDVPIVLYVSGYGRSGSTILDMLLGARDHAVGMSELTHVMNYWRLNQPCSCGSSFRNCEFWQAVFSKLEIQGTEDAGRIETATRTVERYPLWICKILHRAKLHEYGETWTRLLSAISTVSNRKLIIDSSKTTRATSFRANALSVLQGVDVRTIHLVRNPCAVLYSAMRGSNIALEKGQRKVKFGGPYRVLLSWIWTNFMVHATSWFSNSKYVRIRYEDLVANPELEIARIMSDLNLAEFSNVDSLKIDLAASHGVAGNRVRRSGVQNIHLDDEWKSALDKKLVALSMICAPLSKKYGY